MADLNFDYLIADRSYAALEYRNTLIVNGIEPVIPSHHDAQAPATYDAWRYRERHLIERFIGKIKHFRRIFSRFDKLARRISVSCNSPVP